MSDRPARDRELLELIGIAIGEASMCWSERPTGVFESTRASAIVDRIYDAVVSQDATPFGKYEALRAENERLKEALSYLPKVPTEPYEKELAKRLIEVEAENEELKRTEKVYRMNREWIEEAKVKIATIEAENAELRSALSGLLADTQHSDHDCGDEGCPVDIARNALNKETKAGGGE